MLLFLMCAWLVIVLVHHTSFPLCLYLISSLGMFSSLYVALMCVASVMMLF